MTASVLKFPSKVEPKPGESLCYCTKCDGDVFHLYPEGTVKCAACGAAMTNLLVTLFRELH